MTNHNTITQETQPTPEQILASAAEFIDHFGIGVNPRTDKETFLDALRQLDPRFHGDRNLVRWQLEADQTEFYDETKDIIMRTVEAMGILRPETPLIGNYDIVVSLGAARQANLDRARYAAAAMKSDQTQARTLIVTGSDRLLSEQEQVNTANYAPKAITEFDLATGAARIVSDENSHIGVILNHVNGEQANTTDTINTVLSYMGERIELDGLKMAAVTTQIYQPFTAIEVAAAAKEFGVSETFVAGNPSDPAIVAKRTPATYLSEAIRTIRAAVNNIE